MRAADHSQQDARLAALDRYQILDTANERDFDDVVDLAAKLCDAPVALISFVDRERQWFKAKLGLDVDETPIDQSICAYVVLNAEFVEIADTQADPRTQDNPLCIGDEAFRFYAGAVLETEDGLPLGSLCVLDRKPRQLTALQRQSLEVLARQVMRQLELRHALEREALLRKEIDHRVKNSLQSVAAYVGMRKRVSDMASEELGGIQRHIDAVAMLHAHLGRSDSGAVTLDEYFARIVALLDQAAPAVTVLGSFETIPLSTMQLGSIGTIVNELVANALKHDFADGEHGTITLSGVREGGQYRLSCVSDALSRPSEIDSERGDSLGLRIIDAQVRGMSGTITVTRTPHYRTDISFPA